MAPSAIAPAATNAPAPLHGQQARDQARCEARQAELLAAPVSLSIALAPARRWWEADWHVYTHIREMDLGQARVLVAGCGLGAEVIVLSYIAGEVCGTDPSPASVEIAQNRAAQFAKADTFIDVAAAGHLPYPAEHFDLIVCTDALRELEIAACVAEIRRVAKPGATVTINEGYSHTRVDALRNNRFVSERLNPLFHRMIGGAAGHGLAEDGPRLNERDVAKIRGLITVQDESYFNAVTGRFIDTADRWAAKAEVAAMGVSLPAARLCGGRVVLVGRVEKATDARIAAESRVSNSLAALRQPTANPSQPQGPRH